MGLSEWWQHGWAGEVTQVLRLKEEKDRRAQQLEALRVQQEMENPVLAKARKSTEEVDNAIAMLLKEVG